MRSKVDINRIDIYHPDITLDTLDGYVTNMTDTFADDKPMIKQFDVLERWDDGFPKLIHVRNKVGILSEREAIIHLQRKVLEDGTRHFIT